MYSVTGQTEDQQLNHLHCPPRVLNFEIGNDKRCSRFSPNNYVMKHNGAIRRMAENGFAPPTLGNFADISYLVEN